MGCSLRNIDLSSVNYLLKLMQHVIFFVFKIYRTVKILTRMVKEVFFCSELVRGNWSSTEFLVKSLERKNT